MAKKVRELQKNTTMQTPTAACRHPAFNLRYALQGHTSEVHNISLSPDGSTLASSSRDGKVCIWDVESGYLLHALNHGSPVTSTAWSPDGEMVASGTDRIHLWNTKSGKRVRKPSESLKNTIPGLVWGSNSFIMASSANGGSYSWDIKEEHLSDRSELDFDGMVWSPHGDIIAMVINDVHEVLLFYPDAKKN